MHAITVFGTTDTKTAQSPFEMPFTVNSVTRDLVDEQQATLLKDVLRNVSGVVPSTDNGGTNDNFTLRGFELDAFAYRDGVRQDIPQFDPAGIERVDVLKGAAANLYGRIEPGGLVNVITKKPLPERYYSLEQRVGEFDHYRTEGDFTGPITNNGDWLYRFVFSYQNNGSFRDFQDNERLFVFPSLTWSPTQSTTFNLSLEYKNNTDAIDYGIPAQGDSVADLPRERYLGVLGAESERSFYLADLNWSHAFNAAWEFSHKFQWYYNDTDYKDASPSGFFNPFNPDSLDVSVSRPFKEIYDDYFTELRLTGRARGLGVDHELLFGAEYNRAEHDNALFNIVSLLETPALRAIDIHDPVYQRIDDLPQLDVAGNYNSPFFFNLKEREYWYALTAQDIVHVNSRMNLVVSGRYDIMANVQAGSCLVVGVTPCDASLQETEDRVFSPRIGLNYQLLPWLAVYGSYAESFGSPGAGVRSDGSPVGFEEGEQKELGLKGDWFDSRLGATIAFYHLTKSNLAVSTIQPFVGVVTDVVGEARSRGIEFDLRGGLTERWTMTASYTFTDARVAEDSGVVGTPPVLTDGRTGLRLANVPEHALSLWTHYSVNDAFSIAGGVFGMSEREVDADNTVDVPGYLRVDFSARYRRALSRSWLTAQLNINNLFDKQYFDPQTSFARTVNASPAAPRTILGTLRIEF